MEEQQLLYHKIATNFLKIMIYDILIFNNSTKKDYLFQAETDYSDNKLHHSFKDLDLSELPSGEYSYFIIRNDYGKSVEWETSDVPLRSILKYDGKQYVLKDLLPETGLLKIGTENTQDSSAYKKKDVEFAYRKHKD